MKKKVIAPLPSYRIAVEVARPDVDHGFFPEMNPAPQPPRYEPVWSGNEPPADTDKAAALVAVEANRKIEIPGVAYGCIAVQQQLGLFGFGLPLWKVVETLESPVAEQPLI